MGLWGKFLDQTVVFNFDRNGYKRHKRTFGSSDLEVDLSGRQWVVTGANSGIGFETARALTHRGASVRLICRNPERAENARSAIRASIPNADVSVHLADLSELDQVEKVCKTLNGPIHGIVHNAGNMLDTYQETTDGHEVITALHVLGPVRMMDHLNDQLIAGAAEHSCRVIFVASGGMYTQKLDHQALEPSPEKYDGTVHYARTKRAQVVLARHLHGQLQGHGILVHSMHPGWADTPAVRRAMPKFYWLTKGILRTPEQGADTVVWLACCPTHDVEKNGFWFDRSRVPTHAFKKTHHTDEAEAAFRVQLKRLLTSPV